jgi:hypothetical protein
MLFVGDKPLDIAVPTSLWWARGGLALKQDWDIGYFETWIKGRLEIRAHGVEFDRAGVLAMLGLNEAIGTAENHLEPTVSPTEKANANATASREARAAEGRKHVPEAQLRRWYRDRVNNWPTDKRSPNERDDLEAALLNFKGHKVSRSEIRAARSELAPNGWKMPGPKSEKSNS